MTTIMKRATPVAVALMLAWSVSAQAQGFRARTTLVPHLYVGLGTTFYADPLLAGPDYPFGSPRLEGYRPTVEKLHLAPGSTHALREAIEKRAPGKMSAPVPAPSGKQ